MHSILKYLLHRVFVSLKIVSKVALLLPIPAFFVWFNLTVDCSGFFQGERFEREAADALLSGENLGGYEQLNEQKINALIAKNLKQPVDTLAVGSSRILQLNASIADSQSFLNCGVSGADIRDIVGTFYLFEREDKLPKNLIIGVEPWFFNADPNAYNYRSDIELYNEFLSLQLGMDMNFEKPDETAKYKALLSPSYFQGNLTYYLRDSNLDRTPTLVTSNLYNQNTSVKLTDGSVLYPLDFRTAPYEEVEKKAYAEATTFMRMDGYIEPDPTLISIFDQFIRHVKSKGVNVVFLMSSYHPAVYNYATEHKDKYPGFFLCEPWYTEYAKKNQIPLYGSYNPFVAQCPGDYFYDGLHMTGQGIEHIFPGMKEVAIEQQTGSPGSVWVYEGPRVLYETAETLVTQRYQIAFPNKMRQAQEQSVFGEDCYVLEQYESDSDKAIRLASFAVTKNEGIIYRYDTDASTWTVDNRFES